MAQPATIAAVLETLSQHAQLAEEAEITLEVNPTSAGMSRLTDFKQAGINRLSIGVQVNIR